MEHTDRLRVELDDGDVAVAARATAQGQAAEFGEAVDGFCGVGFVGEAGDARAKEGDVSVRVGRAMAVGVPLPDLSSSRRAARA